MICWVTTKFAELDLDDFSINDLLNNALIMAEDRIKLNDITIEKKYVDNMCNVRVDAEKIRVAFFNIIVNKIESLVPGKDVL